MAATVEALRDSLTNMQGRRKYFGLASELCWNLDLSAPADPALFLQNRFSRKWHGLRNWRLLLAYESQTLECQRQGTVCHAGKLPQTRGPLKTKGLENGCSEHQQGVSGS